MDFVVPSSWYKAIITAISDNGHKLWFFNAAKRSRIVIVPFMREFPQPTFLYTGLKSAAGMFCLDFTLIWTALRIWKRKILSRVWCTLQFSLDSIICHLFYISCPGRNLSIQHLPILIPHWVKITATTIFIRHYLCTKHWFQLFINVSTVNPHNKLLTGR